MSGEPRDGPCLRDTGFSLEPPTNLSLVLSLADYQGSHTSRRQAEDTFLFEEEKGREMPILMIQNLFFIPFTHASGQKMLLLLQIVGF